MYTKVQDAQTNSLEAALHARTASMSQFLGSQQTRSSAHWTSSQLSYQKEEGLQVIKTCLLSSNYQNSNLKTTHATMLLI